MWSAGSGDVIPVGENESARVERGQDRVVKVSRESVRPSTFVRQMPADSAVPILVDDPATMVAQWNLSEGIGLVAYPAVGRYAGKIQGNVVWQKSGPPAMPHASLWFGGGTRSERGNDVSTDFVNFGFSKAFSSPSISVGFWAKADPEATYEDMAIVSKYTYAPGSWEFGWGSTGSKCKLYWRMFSHSPAWSVRTQANARANYKGNDFKDGKWHFIVGTYDQASAVLSLYLDGELLATNTIVEGTALNSTCHQLNLGKRSYLGAPGSYRGYLGGPFFIRNRAMNAAEVKRYYQACLNWSRSVGEHGRQTTD